MPLLALSLTSGTLSGSLYPDLFPFSYLKFIFVIVLYPILAALARKRRVVVIVLSLLCTFLIGYLLASYKMSSNRMMSFSVNDEPVFICNGIIKKELRRRKWGSTIDIDLRGCKKKWRGRYSRAYGGVRISTKQKNIPLMPGDHVRFKAKFRSPPEVENFSYRRYLLVHGIAATGWIYGKVYVDEKNDSHFRNAIHDARRRISKGIPQKIQEGRRTIMESLALGKRDGMTVEMRDAFAASGLSHILAISGLHVGLIALIIYFVSKSIFGLIPRLLLVVPLQIMASIITLPAVWGYVLITQGSMSSIRAAIMISIFLLGVILKRRQNLINTLSIAVIAILLAMPLSVLDVSFQLSVTAVLGILMIGYPIVRRLNDHIDGCSLWSIIGRRVISIMAITFAATISTLPLVAYHFNIVTMLGLISNLIAVPLASVLLVPSIFIASIVSLFSDALSHPIWIISSFLAGLLLDFAKLISTHGDVFVFRYKPSSYEMVLAYVILISAMFWKRIRHKIKCW